MSETVKLVPTDALPKDLECLIEAAYWEMKSRQDPTQDQYPTCGERYAFKQSVRNIFYKRRADEVARQGGKG